MTVIVDKIAIPAQSEIFSALDNAYYSDCYAFSSKQSNRVALKVWLDQASQTPAWVNFLMAARNKLVSLVGLKNIGHLSDFEPNKLTSDYQVGDRVGIFTLLYLSDNEVILVDSDKHLDVKISIYLQDVQSGLISISSVVHVHNFLGKFYMFFVQPMHQLIVPSSIKRAEGKLV